MTTHVCSCLIIVLVLCTGVPCGLVAQTGTDGQAVTPAEPPATTTKLQAAANDNRTTAGRMIGGELHVELEAVQAEWYPRGDDGTRIVTPAFAEVDGSPSVPGPLIRAAAGTPVQVTVHNRLSQPIEVRGLTDREPGAAVPEGFPPDFPAFLLAEPLVVPPGESRVARFIDTAAVSSFYYGRVVSAGEPRVAPFLPGGIADEGAFVGGLIIDGVGTAPPPGERVFIITRWGSEDEPNSLQPTWKMMMNGRSWPHTERVDLTVGDTAHWRVINTSLVSHPMHLHGFYFTVEATGNTNEDRALAADEQRDVVTEIMGDISSLRLSWVPERPGNWLFHCHLIRHSGELQRFEIDRAAAGEDVPQHHDGTHSEGAMMDMDGMAGMILGIRVQPANGVSENDPPPARRIDLWTGIRPAVFDGEPELGFVVQEGAEPPSPDSTVVPGSTLVLKRDEPTEIVVHNRLDFPLSVHWHGLELRSLYDGVGHWSGRGGSVRPPIEPGDSQHVVIQPPRAGTFFYHTHGEPGHELAQGLYGAFLVLDPDQTLDPDADRLFMLGSRGADIDAPPVVNGVAAPAPERFQPGRTYRLRFAHISPDETKRVRLLRDGEPVPWVARAKDGADLPSASRRDVAADFTIGVGEAYDFEWTPEQPGTYVLEVRTSFYPSLGGSAVQRIAFGVGDVADEELRRATEGVASAVELSAADRRRYVGTFTGRLLPGNDPSEWVFSAWEENGRLYMAMAPRGEMDAGSYLVPVGDHTFMPGTWSEGMITRVRDDVRIRFTGGLDAFELVEVEEGGTPVFRFTRVDPFELTEDELNSFTGVYGGSDIPIDTHVTIAGGGLLLTAPGLSDMRLDPFGHGRFRVEGGDVPTGTILVFEIEDGRAIALLMMVPGQPPIRVPRAPD